MRESPILIIEEAKSFVEEDLSDLFLSKIPL